MNNETTEVIGMPEAGRRLGCSHQTAAKRLRTARVPLIRLNPSDRSALAVRVADLEAFARQPQRKRGRPHKVPAMAT